MFHLQGRNYFETRRADEILCIKIVKNNKLSTTKTLNKLPKIFMILRKN